jgi:hypothetical protein
MQIVYNSVLFCPKSKTPEPGPAPLIGPSPGSSPNQLIGGHLSDYTVSSPIDVEIQPTSEVQIVQAFQKLMIIWRFMNNTK